MLPLIWYSTNQQSAVVIKKTNQGLTTPGLFLVRKVSLEVGFVPGNQLALGQQAGLDYTQTFFTCTNFRALFLQQVFQSSPRYQYEI